ncbi:TetR/AcrR family transcriptional regulator [Nocardia sp. NBC_00416]|uniref:TetR/AcrR family transcriptional regulator n=1 Tax=Nocardia sp. NBC_00416 TaxID=2975991 RepID=UPI002E224271
MVETRRRGEELEEAIYTAVLDEVAARGYAEATYSGIAARVGTSKPVLYRRWASKAEMVLAAVAARSHRLGGEFPDTGTLAGDLVAVLIAVRAWLPGVGRATVLGLLAELDDRLIEQLRSLLFQRGSVLLHSAVRRARSRGELGASEVPDQVLALPFDLARHDLLIRGVLTDERINEIVHDLVVPVLRHHSFDLPPSRDRPGSNE